MTYTFRTKMVVIGMTLSLFVFTGAKAETAIALEGKSQAVVVVAGDAAEPEKHAASELASFLEQVSGAKFEVLNQYDGNQHRLLVGPGAAQLADKNFSTEGLGKEGLIIRTVGKDLILAGGRPRGTLYAVYTFLEDQVGCRWWAPGESTIPHKATLEVPSLDIRYVPILEMREPYWYVTEDGDWCVRNKVNGGRTHLDPRQGSKFHEMGGCHSFELDIPSSKYFGDHPEWFSQINGQRTGSNAQLCMTNEELIKEYARIIKSNLHNRPEKGAFFNYIADRKTEDISALWIGQNDWGGYCECDKCKAINDREGTPAGALLHFVNAVAEDVEKEFPELAVYTFAYDWSQKPPQTITPRSNVVIWLATTGCKYNVPYTHEINSTFQNALDGWSKIHNRIYIWDYVTNYQAYLCPLPNIRTLAPNVEYFASHNVRGVFSQGAASAPGAEMAALRAWVTAKLLWDPSLDGDRLVGEFLDGYFGPAAQHIKAYLDVFHDAIESTGEYIYMMEQPVPNSREWLNLETLGRGMKHMRDARAVVGDDPDLKRRIEIAELSLLYVFMVGWDVWQEQARAQGLPWPFETGSLQQVFDRFQAVRQANKISMISEANARDVFAAVEERVALGRMFVPPGCEDLSRDRWADLQEIGFSRNTHVTRLVEDKAASNSSAVWMPGAGTDKMVHKETRRIPLVYLAALKNKPLRVRLSVRCELSGKEGIAFKYGLDTQNRMVEVKAAEIAGDGYHTYDLGIFDDLQGWGSLWVSPADNAGNVKGIWVDRIWLVMED